VDEGGGIEGGFELDIDHVPFVGIKSYMSIAKTKATKELREGKQLTIKG
jgi:hypothetical protein